MSARIRHAKYILHKSDYPIGQLIVPRKDAQQNSGRKRGTRYKRDLDVYFML
jgi:hypothetical protein